MMQKKMHKNTGEKWLPVIRSKTKRTQIFVLFLIAILVSICALLTSCGKIYADIKSAELVLYYEGFFYENRRNQREDIELIETDSYGRKLYCYSAMAGEYFYEAFSDYYATATEEGDFAQVFIIVQKTNRTKTYFYAGKGLYFSFEPSMIKEGLDEFKEKNDWNRPLDTEKMVGVRTDASIEDTKLEEIMGKATFNHYLGAVYDPELNPIHVIRVIEKRTGTDPIVFTKTVAFTINEQNETESSINLEGSPEDWLEQIESFRKTGDGSLSSTDSD